MKPQQLPLDVVILAAGKGTRMNSDLPKVLHKLAGRPLVAHAIDCAKKLNPNKICVVYGHGGELVPTALADNNIAWALQAEQKGTGHAVMQALPYLDREGVTLILYGDVPLLRSETVTGLVDAAGTGKLAILTVELDDPTGYGRIIRDMRGRVRGIVEQKDASRAELEIREINTGIMAVPTEHLHAWLPRLKNQNAQGEYYLTDIVALAVKSRVPIVTAKPAFEWEVLGVNSKGQLVELERTHQRNLARDLLKAGVTLMDPVRLDVRGELTCGRDVVIDINCLFEGRVELGDGVEVGANCVLRNVTVGAGTRIAPFSLLEDARIGPRCRIGPFARLRPGAELAEDVHIGNFVEVKNSRIADRSKANHLAYIGDAEIGRDVNVGAGTITCNYDGANKHQTVIGDNAFIGSNASLVAPVRIGRNATIGAGSTVTKEAPEEALTVTRARQLTVKGWKRPQKSGIRNQKSEKNKP